MAIDSDKIDHVVRMHAARDKVLSDLLARDDPDSVRKATQATDFWLEAENSLNAEEFTEYMVRWRAHS